MELNGQTLFKALDGLNPANGGQGRYPGVGRWTRHLNPDRLDPCVYGFHLARGSQILNWLKPTLYVAEPCPDHPLVHDDAKLVTCRVRLVERLDRWDETTARLFAADCAEAALLGERASGREPDERSWSAVVAARRFARGEISSAAWAAASVAARAAAGDAAWSAARSASRAAATSTARFAACFAARDAAFSAARSAAMSTARDAQYERLTLARDAQYERLTLYLTGADLPPVEPLYGKDTK